MHHFRGRGGESQINKISFQSLCSQRELVGVGGCGRRIGGEGGGGMWPATENCCPYPQRSVYTTCKVKQIDPGRRFTCVFVRLPVNLPACHLQSLCCVADPTALSLSFSVCAYVCLFAMVFVFVFLSLCIALCTFICVSSHMCARPGSREALRKTSG